jgi:hypothetical protein
MTVRLTPTESDTPPLPQVPAPPDPGDIRVTPQGVNIPGDIPTEGNGEVASGPIPGQTPVAEDAPPGPPKYAGSPVAADGRRALREARRQRRRAMWLCAAFVALCLALTIVVVTLARYRPVGPSSALTVTTTVPSAVVPTPAPVVDRVPASTVPSRGAPASEGGNP